MTDVQLSGPIAATCAVLFVLLWAFGPAVRAADSTDVTRLFADPPREYSTAPFWVWNDRLTEAEVVHTLRDLAGRGIKEAFVHPRPGLVTPYLGDEWFDLWRVALEEAERLDMNLWIYDENSYPSGFAGGHVPEAMPEARGRGLVLEQQSQPPGSREGLVAVFHIDGSECHNVTARVGSAEPWPEGDYLVASVRRAGDSPWFGGRCYVDLLLPEVTPEFLAVTLNPYQQRFGQAFGERIPGVFTDEPHLRPAPGWPWTDDLPERFEARWGYRLTDHLPGLERPVGDWKRVRHNYFQTLSTLFIERWARPYYEYCEERGLEFTGHYWEHEWPHCLLVPDNMALYAWQQRPGIDTLMNEYSEDTHAQFGNVRAVKELASVANQLGRKRTLCEAYGAAGWNLRFEDMKRIGDWLYVLGVNTLNQHLSFVSIRGMRKRDHPPTFSYHEPWWGSYQVCADYYARLSAALSQGEEINRILVIAPTTTVWLYQNAAGSDPKLAEIGRSFQQLVVDLARAQVEFDLGCEEIIAEHGAAGGKGLRVGRRAYDVVIIPPLTENLNARTIELLEQALENGARVLCCGDPPDRVDGQLSARGADLARNPNWEKTDPENLRKHAALAPRAGFALLRGAADGGVLFHHRRQLSDGELVFLANTSIDAPSSGTIRSNRRGVDELNLETGEKKPYPFERDGESGDVGIEIPYELPPCGSVLLLLTDAMREPQLPGRKQVTTIDAGGPVEIRRRSANVLTLDYVDVAAGGESLEQTYVLNAADFVFSKHGLGRNPWDGAVQFRDEIVAKAFSKDSGFEATYRFTIRDRVPAALFAVIERADLYAVSCNGRRVEPEEGAWWLDRSFLRIDIASAARVGPNELRVVAAPLTVAHELEAAYIVGDFSLEPADTGFVIGPPRDLRLGPWNAQGCPLYGDGVTYAQEFVVSEPSGRYAVALGDWNGSVAEVAVNGRPAGIIFHAPWECDITSSVQPGSNRIEITVIGTLRNTLGPHHGNPPLGRTWPAMFRQAPETGPPNGAAYATIGYGLFEPFVLRHVAE